MSPFPCSRGLIFRLRILLRIQPDGAHWRPVARVAAPALRAAFPRCLVDGMTAGKDFDVLSAVTLVGGDVFDAPVLVLIVVPVGKASHPLACGLHRGKAAAREVGHVFAGSEQRFDKRVVVTDPRPAERGSDAEFAEHYLYGLTLDRVAVVAVRESPGKVQDESSTKVQRKFTKVQESSGQAQRREFTYPNSANFPICLLGKANYAGGSSIIEETAAMPQARKRLVSTQVTSFYHVVSRCVRRHFLCGIDPYTGKDYTARKKEIKDRLALLAEVFAIDVCSFAVLSNHYHLVIHIDEQTALEWSPLEVAQRWTRLFTGPVPVRAFVAGQKLTETQQSVVHNHIQDYRKRLCSLSWFMKCLNEPIARQANQEDNVTGHFWQARFSSQALLDEAAVLTAMAYVDLNPIRAGIAETPETSGFTSVQQRIGEWKDQQNKTVTNEAPPAENEKASLDATMVKLLRFSEDSKESDENAIPYSTSDYLELVDWSGRAIVEDKKGFIPDHLPPILQRLKLDPAQYLAYVKNPRFGFAYALGAVDKIKAYAEHFEKAFLKGQTAAAALFSPGR